MDGWMDGGMDGCTKRALDLYEPRSSTVCGCFYFILTFCINVRRSFIAKARGSPV
jgi:hypothetical protein